MEDFDPAVGELEREFPAPFDVWGRFGPQPLDLAAKQGPEDAMIPALTAAGLSAHWAGLYKEMTHGMNTGHVAFEGGKVRTATGSTEVGVVLRQLIGPR